MSVGIIILAAAVLIPIVLGVRVRRRLRGDAALQAANAALETRGRSDWIADLVLSGVIWFALVALAWTVWVMFFRSFLI